MQPGVQLSYKKNGDEYFRSSITYRSKHISLGSYDSEKAASDAYSQASAILSSSITIPQLSSAFSSYSIAFDKAVILINFRDNNVYFNNPIYLMKNYFNYYLTFNRILTFDIDDLFYYSNHKIQQRGGRLFITDYGMQITLQTRYGIKPHAVKDRDYEFLNGDDLDFRYENIHILSRYTGVLPGYYNKGKTALISYKVKIHFKGNYTVGIFNTEEEAAVAYNKAADFIISCGFKKNYIQNYIDSITAKEFAEIYTNINIESFKNKFISLNS